MSRNPSSNNAPNRPAFNLCVQVPEGRDSDGSLKLDSEKRVKTKLFRCGALWESKSGEGFSGNWVDTLFGQVHRVVLMPCKRGGDNAPAFEVFIANGASDQPGLMLCGAVWPFPQSSKTDGFSGQIDVPLLGLSTRIALLPPKEGED